MSDKKPQLGVDYLAIPCSTDGSKDSIRPSYLGQVLGPYGFYLYECPRCHKMFYSNHAAKKHMGLVSNIMGSCTGR